MSLSLRKNKMFKRSRRQISQLKRKRKSQPSTLSFEKLEARQLLATVAFIDSSVWDQGSLPAGLTQSVDEVVILDSSIDGIQQMADYLDGRTGIDAVHIMSHGDVGEVSPLGNAILNAGNLASYSTQLATIGDSLTADGDILLWGCAVAGLDGTGFVQDLAGLTGADVAASTDLTGSPNLGGDWDLEYSTGTIEAANIFAGIDPQIILSHFRGGTVTHSVSSSGLITVESFNAWRTGPYTNFQLFTGPGRTGTNLGTFSTNSNQGTLVSTGTEFGGAAFSVYKQTHTFNAASLAPGTYYANFQSNARVSGIQNAPQSRFGLETGIVFGGVGVVSASPTLLPATIDIVAQGHTYAQNLNSSDPDGTPVSFSFLVGSNTPTLGPNFQATGINLDSLGTVNISAANTDALSIGRWVYKVRVTDGQGAYSERDVLFVVVNPANTSDPNPSPPILSPIGPQIIPVGTAFSLPITGTDPDGENITVRSQLLPTGATMPEVTANMTATSTFSWTPALGQEGTYFVNFETFESDESVPIIDSELVEIQVVGANDPPILDSIGNKTVANNGTISFTVIGSDADGDNLTYSAFFLPAGATFNPSTRQFNWTPGSGQSNNTFTGITFRVTDDGVPNLYDEQAINITVGAGNIAPIFDPLANITVLVGQSVSVPIQVTDTTGQSIDLTSLVLPSGSSFSSATGATPVTSTFTWTPTLADVGANTVKLRAEDNGSPILSSISEFVITVVANQAPVATSDEYNLLEGQTITTTDIDGTTTSVDTNDDGILANDSDPDGDPLTLSLVSGPAFASSFALNLDGTFSYTHDGSENFTDSFVYQIDDGQGETATATVTLHIAPVNDAPTVDLNGSNDTGADFTAAFTEDGGPVSIADNDLLVTDADSIAPGSIYIVDNQQGVLRIDPATGAQAVVSSGGLFVAVEGLTIDTDGSLLTFDHDEFTIVRIDPLTSVQTLVVTDPARSGGHSIVVEDDGNILVGTHTGLVRVNPGTGAITDLVSGIAHVRGLAIESNGQILLAHANEITRVNPVTGATTSVSQGGNLTDVYGVVVDSNGDIYVADANDGEIIKLDPVSGVQTVFAAGNLLAAGVTGLTQDWNGDFLVSDDASDELIRVDAMTAAQTVVSSGDKFTAPLHVVATSNLVLQSATIRISNLLDGTDELLAVDSTGTNITPNYDSGTGVLTLTGSDTFANYEQVLRTATYDNSSQDPTLANRFIEFTVNDGTDSSAVTTTTLTVTSINDAPVIANGDLTLSSASIMEGGSTTLTGSFIDPDANDTHTVSINWGDGSSATIFALAAGVLTFSESHVYADDLASGSIFVTVNDGNVTDSASKSITVNNVNPTATADSATISESGSAITINVLATDTDPAGAADPLMVTSVDLSGTTRVVTFTNNDVTYDPDGQFENLAVGETAIDTFTYTISDGDGGTSAATVTITIIGQNDAPEIHSVDFSAPENQTDTGTVVASDIDNNTTLSYSLSATGTDNGLFSINASSGMITFNATPDFESPVDQNSDGVYMVEVQVDDGIETTTQSIPVTVTDVNDAPIIITDSLALDENQAIAGEVIATDQDLNDTLTYSITSSGPDNSLFAIDASTGVLTFIDSPDFEDPLDVDHDNVYEVEVQVTDQNGLTDVQIMGVTVENLASITGTVFVDVNGDGLMQANEPGLDGVTIELLDSSGDAVLDGTGTPITATTSNGGFYLFEDLNPGEYQIHELQPTGVTDGAELLGSAGGSVVANDTMQLTLERNDVADYVFAELGQDLTGGDTASIGFWQNKHGQALISSGGSGLAVWLTSNFGNVFGDSFNDGAGGDDGAEVASFYKYQLFKQKAKKSKGPAKVDAQFMATALATYFTSSNLAGYVAVDFGFYVTATGIGTKVVNVGNNGAAFDVADDTDMTIMQLLSASNALTDIPDNKSGDVSIYDLNGDGVIDAEEAALRGKAHAIYSRINSMGDI